MEKLAKLIRNIKTIAEIYRNRRQVALLLPDGCVCVLVKGNVTFFAGVSEFANHSLANRIMTDEVIYFRFE